jgi:hypothetical protein
MNFLIGVALGALGMWAYRSGKLQRLTGAAPEQAQQAFTMASERINQVATSEQVRSVASTLQDRVQQAKGPEIAMPSAAEVAGRPAEPLPRQEPEGV